jgi:dTDP-4-dehydrorhamnose reductase
VTSPHWLVTGAGGMLGRDLVAALTHTGTACTAATRRELDITDPAAVAAAVPGHDLVVNTAAWTAVDAAEQHEADATMVNGFGARNLAAACRTSGAILLHLSTDSVFPGDADTPYREDAPVAPLNAYARSKLAGEHAVRDLLPTAGYVVRTAWLYGAHGSNFVATVLRLATEQDTIDVVTDQVGQPTWTAALAEHLVELGSAALAGRAPPGVYHGTAAGQATWYALAREAFAFAGLDPNRVQPTISDRFDRPARRPAYSVLGHNRWAAAGMVPLDHWLDMLRHAFAAGVFTRPPSDRP